MDTLTTPRPIRITLAFEVLPAVAGGRPHAVDPDPDAMYDEYPVSLCGVALIVRGGHIDITDPCPVCIEISKERQAEFDAERGQSAC